MNSLLLLFSITFFSTTSAADAPEYLDTNPVYKHWNYNDKWYICATCCKTKKASQAPWEQGCRKSSSGTHTYWVAGNAGDYNYTCRNCDAEVYLTSSQGPSASKCCGSGSTHDWYHR